MVVKQIVPGHQLRRHHDWNPNFHAQARDAALKHRGSDTNDGVGVLIDFYVLADDVLIRGEMRLPKAVTDHGNWGGPRLLVLRGKKAAPQNWPHTQHIKIIRSRYHAPDTLGFAFARQAERGEDKCRDGGKTLLPVAQSLDIRI